MRYNDEELFDTSNTHLDMLKMSFKFNSFCEWACQRLQYLIEESTKQENWMDADINHLRNYRIKAIKFYEQKKGK